MERDRLTPSLDNASSAPAAIQAGDASSFLDSVMDLLEPAHAAGADEAEIGQAEANLSRQLRRAIGARLRDAA